MESFVVYIFLCLQINILNHPEISDPSGDRGMFLDLLQALLEKQQANLMLEDQQAAVLLK